MVSDVSKKKRLESENIKMFARIHTEKGTYTFNINEDGIIEGFDDNDYEIGKNNGSGGGVGRVDVYAQIF